MKKITNNLRSKIKRKDQGNDLENRVTGSNIEDHKKEILARGKRFVYPLHMSKKHVVRNSIFVVIGFLLLFIATSTVAIYRYKASGSVIYRISTIIPYPAAKVDGKYVRYSDYLAILRTSEAFIKQQEKQGATLNEENRKQLKEQALRSAKRNAKLLQIAKEEKISVNKQEIDEQIEMLKSVSGGEKRLDDIVGEFYGINSRELRRDITIQLLKLKVAPLISDREKEKIEGLHDRAVSGEDFAELAKIHSDNRITGANGGSLGVIDGPQGEVTQDLYEEIKKLKVGEISGIVAGRQGFHILKKLSEDDGGNMEAAHIFINYTNVNEYLESQLNKSSVKDYISI